MVIVLYLSSIDHRCGWRGPWLLIALLSLPGAGGECDGDGIDTIKLHQPGTDAAHTSSTSLVSHATSRHPLAARPCPPCPLRSSLNPIRRSRYASPKTQSPAPPPGSRDIELYISRESQTLWAFHKHVPPPPAANHPTQHVFSQPRWPTTNSAAGCLTTSWPLPSMPLSGLPALPLRLRLRLRLPLTTNHTTSRSKKSSSQSLSAWPHVVPVPLLQ